jgi:hypothetical protein
LKQNFRRPGKFKRWDEKEYYREKSQQARAVYVSRLSRTIVQKAGGKHIAKGVSAGLCLAFVQVHATIGCMLNAKFRQPRQFRRRGVVKGGFRRACALHSSRCARQAAISMSVATAPCLRASTCVAKIKNRNHDLSRHLATSQPIFNQMKSFSEEGRRNGKQKRKKRGLTKRKERRTGKTKKRHKGNKVSIVSLARTA